MSDGSEFDCKGGCGRRTANLTGTCLYCQGRLRLWTNDSDFVIAESQRAAHALMKESEFGHDYDGKPEDWRVYNSPTFTYWEDDHPGDNDTTKPVKQWIQERGRGYFATCEF